MPSKRCHTILHALTLTMIIFSACKNKTLFEAIPSDHSGVHFNNLIVENDSVNPMDLTNIYNGGGVGIGDFNRDGRPDIYFAGNTVSNKLYLNRGDFKFDDITDRAGVGGQGEWCRGVTVVDINNDGWPDIYVCATILDDPKRRRNLLYINQGNDKDGIPHFREMGREYGLGDTLYSTMAEFFDYDKDGDLDMYLVVNDIPKHANAALFRPTITDGSYRSTGHLFRNDWNDSLKHPVFTDVSKQAGITIEGYGHSATIADVNRDGWPDIYVSNDFVGNDILYINNHDGTFTDKIRSYFKHTSANSMGQDIEDVNNDGLMDFVVMDMDPPDNYRKKMFMAANNYRYYQNTEYFGYEYQYPRNTLQINQGPRVGEGDSTGDPVFSDMGYYAGIEATDWSWTPMVADFDNDGYRDIIVTNGYPRDVNDHDFIMFRNEASQLVNKQRILDQIPRVKIHSFAFRNNGDLTFSNVSADWGLMTPGYSNGAAYADLDGDGDLDLIVNNIDDEAHIYRNMSREHDPDNQHYLQVSFAGDSLNKGGFGAWVELRYGAGQQQVYENSPYRGYLSTIQDIAHFGLGKIAVIDTVRVKWPDGKMQEWLHIPANGTLVADHRNARLPYAIEKTTLAKGALFREITDSIGLHFKQEQRDYIDFNIQKMLPHKFSQYGPSIAVGDVDGNGLDDMVVGGAEGQSAQIFLQQPGGHFIKRPLLSDSAASAKLADDLQVLLFDADGDGDPDLYIAAGGYAESSNSPAYRDHLYINDGKGNFTPDPLALPANFTSKFCVRAADYNHDGKLDLFVSGRVDPEHYPQPVSSFVYRNDSHDGKVRFTDVSATVAPELQHIGMVCDAVWTDFDNDGWPDLVLAGEWMPVTFLRNDKGIFRNIGAASGVNDHKGWWNSIIAGDFDNDGKMDYVVGNLGLNSFYRADPQHPVRAYGGDFDKNGIYDMIPSCYLPDQEGKLREFPAESRDDLLRQINSMRKKFPDYKTYAVATMDKVLTPEERKNVLVLEANDFRSCLLRNEGDGHFSIHPLPMEAQLSVIDGMVADDVDGDGKLDLLLSGNDYGEEPVVGRSDAMNGLILKGDGKGGFIPLPMDKSGIFLPGDQKALVRMRGDGTRYWVVAGQNRGPLQVFERRSPVRFIPLRPDDVSAVFTYADGLMRKEECGYGSSFLSQSGRFIVVSGPVRGVEITNAAGQKRSVL
ncbi:MAG TPA: VCBS repeat-containing protein [Puia sp.]|nr:VCBS repeat-containing protein [Puia sp.]